MVEPPDLFTANVPSALRDQCLVSSSSPVVAKRGRSKTARGCARSGSKCKQVAGPLDFTENPSAYRDLRARRLRRGRSACRTWMRTRSTPRAIFPTFAQELRFLSDADTQIACVRRLQRCGRRLGATRARTNRRPALVPSTGLDDALAELTRAAAMGLRGVIFTGWPAAGDKPQPAEDRFWAQCAEAGLAVHLIAGGPLATDRIPSTPTALPRRQEPGEVGRRAGRDHVDARSHIEERQPELARALGRARPVPATRS